MTILIPPTVTGETHCRYRGFQVLCGIIRGLRIMHIVPETYFATSVTRPAAIQAVYTGCYIST